MPFSYSLNAKISVSAMKNIGIGPNKSLSVELYKKHMVFNSIYYILDSYISGHLTIPKGADVGKFLLYKTIALFNDVACRKVHRPIDAEVLRSPTFFDHFMHIT